MKHLNLLFFSAILISFVSCEYTYPYLYVVTNSTDTVISLHIKTYKSDSLYQMQRGEKKIIYETEHGIESSKGPYFKDVNKDFNQFSVSKGSLISNRNYLSNSSWIFEKGEYSTSVLNTEF